MDHFIRTFPSLLTFALRRIENLGVSEILICPSLVQKHRELEVVAGSEESDGDIPTLSIILLGDYIHPVGKERLAHSRGRSIRRNWRVEAVKS